MINGTYCVEVNRDIMTAMEPLNRTGLALVQTVSDMALSDIRTEPRQPPDLPVQTASVVRWGGSRGTSIYGGTQ